MTSEVFTRQRVWPEEDFLCPHYGQGKVYDKSSDYAELIMSQWLKHNMLCGGVSRRFSYIEARQRGR